jgi:DNA transformation protein and related proteins
VDAEGLKELFESFGRISVKSMFGGHGLYADGCFFALEIDGEIYLKVDIQTEAAFLSAGSEPFSYKRHTKQVKLSFWRLPADAYDDSEELRHWSNLALEAARRAGEAKAGKTNSSKPKVRKTKTSPAPTGSARKKS